MDAEFAVGALEQRLAWLVEDHPELKTVNRAFPAWVLLQYLGVPEDEAVESVVDGSDDKWLDAILVPEDGEALAVVQTKLWENHDKSFPANEIEKTLNGVDWLLNGNLADVDNVAFVAKAEAFLVETP